MVDMAHFAGLVAAGLHPSPVPHAHVVDLHHPQDPGRPARRRHPHQRRRRSPRRSTRRSSPASRAARWSTSSPPRPSASRWPLDRSSRTRQQRTLAAPGSSRSGWSQPDVAGRRHHGPHRRHRRAPGAGRPARLRTSTASRPRTGSRGRHHRQPQRRAVRPAPADGDVRACGSARRRWPPAVSATRVRRGRRHHRRRAHRGSDAHVDHLAAQVRTLAEQFPLYPEL